MCIRDRVNTLFALIPENFSAILSAADSKFKICCPLPDLAKGLGTVRESAAPNTEATATKVAAESDNFILKKVKMSV